MSSYFEESLYLSKIELVANFNGSLTIYLVRINNCSSASNVCENVLQSKQKLTYKYSPLFTTTISKGNNSLYFTSKNFVDTYSILAWSSPVTNLVQLEAQPNTGYNRTDYFTSDRITFNSLQLNKRFAIRISGQRAFETRKCTVVKTYEFIGKSFTVQVKLENLSQYKNLFSTAIIDSKFLLLYVVP